MTKSENTIQRIVARENARLRLDIFLARELPKFSRSRIQQLIRGGFVRLNRESAKPRDILRPGDVVELSEPPPQKIDNRPEAIPLEIIFEDAELVVINKPPGLVVHPGAGHAEHTLVNALLHHCPSLSGIGGKERPGIVHRLDKDTSGCLVVAKTDDAHRALAKQFADRTVEKVYLAIVAGKLRKGSGVIEGKIGRHRVHRQRMSVESGRGRPARTEYRVVRQSEEAALIECKLHSGRTHQIRVHLHHLGHPVLGDKIYGARLARKFSRQMLHAWKLGFTHPQSGDWRLFEAPVPDDFKEALREIGI